MRRVGIIVVQGASRSRSRSSARSRSRSRRGAGPESKRNETGDGLANPPPNTTGAALQLCNAVKGYPDVPRYCTQLRAVRSI